VIRTLIIGYVQAIFTPSDVLGNAEQPQFALG
jgi:hypothetical protein